MTNESEAPEPDSVGYVNDWSQAKPNPCWSPRSRGRAFIRSTLLSSLSLIDFRQQTSFLRCLYCHHVFDDQTADFRKLLLRLKNQAEFVDSDTCIAMTRGTLPVKGRFFHLSFDDGFANVVRNAAPVLVDLKIPAVFFVPTGFIGSTIEHARRFFAVGSDYRGTVRFASWSELAEAASAGLEIGSHTRNHVRLSSVTDEAGLHEELIRSKAEIETQLGRPCHYFSWPFGRQSDISSPAISLIEAAGYRGCFGAFRGTITPRETSRFRLPRHHFEVQWPTSHIRYFAEGHQERG